MKKLMLWILISAVAVALIAAVLLAVRPARDGTNTAMVRRGTIATSVDALGTVDPIEQQAVAPLVSGIVVKIHVQEGDVVAAGDLLLELDQADALQTLEQAQRGLLLQEAFLAEALAAPDSASVRLAKARLRRATAARRVAQEDYDEVADAVDAEESDEALDLEVAKLEYEIADAEYERVMEGASGLELEQRRAELATAQVRVDQAQRQLKRMQLISPMAGTVLDISAQVGMMAYAGNRLVTLADLSHYEVLAEIDELDIGSMAEGQIAEIRFDAFPGEMISGRVERILPEPIDDRGTTAYAALVSMDGEGLALRPGMGASLKIISRQVDDTLLVPRRAVEQAGQLHYVRVREGRQEVQLQIVVGLSNDSEIEVLSGLTEGALVVVD